ncbi:MULTISPECIES: leucine-rich repeat domain-containing protein [unclassified Leisingera]|uniref:leucine-rich repeat domain-containing protein n=1 Tax=unclassified Leisingera TaxID=2614906 RepID=UPI001ED99A06|nr:MULTISPECIES: leucine-rich repeat domain-containing protein [unclassified Leisingera]
METSVFGSSCIKASPYLHLAPWVHPVAGRCKLSCPPHKPLRALCVCFTEQKHLACIIAAGVGKGNHMPGLRSFFAFILLAAWLSLPFPAQASCAAFGSTCIKDNNLEASIRLGARQSDLQELVQFQQLTSLSLIAEPGFEDPVDLSPLAQLPNLEKLALVGLGVSGLEPLTRLPELRRLSLDSVRTRDFTPLAQLTRLEHLSVWGIRELTDLSFLRGYNRLQSLNIADSGVTDLEPLAGMATLENLLAFNTGISDLAPLAAANLRVVWISGCPVQSLAPLAASSSLEMLRADGSRLQSLEGLQNKPALHTVVLTGSSVADLSPLASAGRLAELNLAHTRVQDLAPLSNLSALQTVVLDGTTVSNLKPLAGPSLRELSAIGTAVISLAPVRQMPGLKELGISGTAVRDLQPLEGLKNLSILRAIGLPQETLLPLLRTENLKILYAGPEGGPHRRLLGRKQIARYVTGASQKD